MNPQMKIKKRFSLLVNPDNNDATDVFLYGYVTDERWWDGEEVIATKEVREQLQGIKTGIINLHINSYGGSAFDGIAIHNLLKQHKATVNVYIDGIAASAASVIAMAGDKIYMPANTILMVHRASTIAWGNADALRNEATALDKLDMAVTASYKGRFVGDDKELAELLKGENGDGTHLTAEEAKALGFCDEVLKDIKEEDPPDGSGDPPEPPKNTLLKKYGFTGKPDNKEKPQTRLNITACLTAFLNVMDKKKEEQENA